MYPNVTIPEPLDFYYNLWSSDPLYRGSYATWPPSFLPEHHANLRADVGGKVWFASEATSKYHFGACFRALHASSLLTRAFV